MSAANGRPGTCDARRASADSPDEFPGVSESLGYGDTDLTLVAEIRRSAAGPRTGRRNMNSLLAVVVSHGGSPHLAALLQALVGLAGCRVVLVENKIGTRHRDVPAAVQVCSGHGNVGYGAAVNLAVRQALAG